MPSNTLGPDWLDAMLEPTIDQAMQAKKLGYYAVGFYIGGTGVDPAHIWSSEGINVLRNVGLVPVPIYVPAPTLPTAPDDAAKEAYNLAKSVGCNPLVSVLYNGNHEQPVVGPVWLPIPGPKPTTIGSQSAIQWGQTSINGWKVDISSAANDFPYQCALAVDFEYNTNYDPQWYAAFQQTISNLTKGIPLPNSNFTVQDVVAAVMLAIRQEFAGGELFDRVIQANNESIKQNGIVSSLTTLISDLDTRGSEILNVVQQIYNTVAAKTPPSIQTPGPNPSGD